MFKTLTTFITGVFLLGFSQGNSQGFYYSAGLNQFTVLENIEGKTLSSGISGGIGYEFENHFLTDLQFDCRNLKYQSLSKSNSTLIFTGGISFGYVFDFENNFRMIQLLGGSYSYYNPKTEVYQFGESKYMVGGFSRTEFQFLVSDQISVSQIIEYHVLNSNKIASVMVGDFSQLLSFGFSLKYYLDQQKYIPPVKTESLDYYAAKFDQTDRDFDGVPDYKDNCPDIPGTKDKYGCPDDDNDSDGISNSMDGCVEEPETFNGFEDEDGCPDSIVVVLQSQEVLSKTSELILPPVVPETKIVNPIPINTTAISDIPKNNTSEFSELKINFKGSPSALKRDQVEKLMMLDREIKSTRGFKLLEITVYCWDQSNQSENKKTGEKRLKVIVDFLIHSGIKKEEIKSSLILKKHNKGDGQYYEYKIMN